MTTNRKLEALARLNLGPGSTAPSLDKVLSGIGPLPREALFLGIASDGLPVLLNLYDPGPGPILVAGDPGAGKTAFLHTVARSLVRTHTESEVQFGVITGKVDEWGDAGETGHRVGIFDVHHAGAQDFILSLASWAHSNKNTHQTILILVDDLEALTAMEGEALQKFRWLLLRGPARRVWPILTLNAERYAQVLAWIEIFRTRIFGRVTAPPASQALGGDAASALDQLVAGTEFCLRENGGWLRFWLPSF